MRSVTAKVGSAGKPEIFERPLPVPKEGQALVKTLSAGVDATDLEIIHGKYGYAPCNRDYLVLGHEAVGVIEKGTEGFYEGDLVVPTVRRPCPQNCPSCRSGRMDMCMTGDYLERGIKGIDGFMSEYFTEYPKNLVRIPSEIKDLGVLLEPLSVVEKGIWQIYSLQQRLEWAPQTALVLGAGPIGLFAAMLLRMRGLRVHIFDRVPDDHPKARVAASIGAEYLDSNKTPLEELPKDSDGFDVIFEATGNSSLALNAISHLAHNAIMCLAGISGRGRMFEICSDCINMQLVLGNRVVFGTVNSSADDFTQGAIDLVRIMEKWPTVPEALISRRVSLDDFNDAFERREGDIKTVIELGK